MISFLYLKKNNDKKGGYYLNITINFQVSINFLDSIYEVTIIFRFKNIGKIIIIITREINNKPFPPKK